MKVGIVGCGYIAEYHLRFLGRMPGIEVVGLADVDPARSRLLGDQHGVMNRYDSLTALLNETRPDVVHVLTPPERHLPDVLAALEADAHVFVEKPLALSSLDTKRMYEAAARHQRTLCPDFIHLFNPCTTDATALVRSGQLGRVVLVDGYLSVDVNEPTLRESWPLSWRHRLPGGVMQDFLPHLLYMLLSWVDQPERVEVVPKSTGVLPQGLTDHVEIHISGVSMSARGVLSFATRPTRNDLRIICERGSVLVDLEHLMVTVDAASPLPQSVARGFYGWMQGTQLIRRSSGTLLKYFRGRVFPYQGLERLLFVFYAGIREGLPPPIAPSLALAVAETEERVLKSAGTLTLDLASRPAAARPGEKRGTVVVTGAAGLIGKKLVDHLVDHGYHVRALVRPLNHTTGLERADVVYGDVRDYSVLLELFQGATAVVHLAAALRGSPEYIEESSIAGTNNVARAAKAADVKHVVHMSSASVYDFLKNRGNGALLENAKREERPQERGVASAAKIAAEEISLKCLGDACPAWTVLRPAIVFDDAGDLTRYLGFSVGPRVLVLGRRTKKVSFIHVQDLCEAVLRVLESESTRGKIYNLAYPEPVVVNQYFKRLEDALGRRIPVIFLRQSVAAVMATGVTLLNRVTGIGPRVSGRRLAFLFGDMVIDGRAISRATGWEPRRSPADWFGGPVNRE